MATLQVDCPRCGAKLMTADVPISQEIGSIRGRRAWELLSVCRKCRRGAILRARAIQSTGVIAALTATFVPHTANGSIDAFVEVLGPIGTADFVVGEVPEHLPPTVHRAYVEAVTCKVAGCPNAAGAMFRLTMELATKERLAAVPSTEAQPNSDVKGNLLKRLAWLFDNGYLPKQMRDLAKVVRENANDAAHDGNLAMEDADDLHDFSEALLYEIYTVPGRIGAINKRRASRRAS
ncbi:hypothetical protein LMG26842_02672 [Achromobacter dolens]|uniref:DUF4145 domain-containing protein n=1 Tax=Achromobacter dolens TaxID=1287738 RepID=UPI0014661431|nr:DUF4145 domain-containing protein [Achromobacter dolens]CAB3847695.1 hypothetical protein LMG26842_02672 [Achromobacter dolens]